MNKYVYFLCTLESHCFNGEWRDTRDEFPSYGIYTDREQAEADFQKWVEDASYESNYEDCPPQDIRIHVVLFRAPINHTFTTEETDVIRWADVNVEIPKIVVDVTDRSEEMVAYNCNDDE